MTRARMTAALLCGAVMLSGMAVAALGGSQLWRAQRANAAISRLNAGGEAVGAATLSPFVQLARMRSLIAQGRIDAAQVVADDLANAPAGIQGPLHYALGNARMRRALDLMRKVPFWKVKPVIAQAKAEYRLAIQADAANWDARYNYAIASTFLRDTEQAQPTVGEGMAHERAAWPDIPGAPNGMP